MSQRELIIGKLITNGPTNITDLATEVARDTGTAFQSALADIWDVVGDGLAGYNSSALVSLAATACPPEAGPRAEAFFPDDDCSSDESAGGDRPGLRVRQLGHHSDPG